MNGWEYVHAVVETSSDWAYRFVAEAQKRGICTPRDMMLVSHGEYEEKRNRFCEKLFAEE